jgi:predicted transcriptional regulator
MPDGDNMTHLSARVPADVLAALDKVASIIDRPRSWVVVRALHQYLDAEGAELLRDAESLAALDRGEGHDLEAVLDEADAIIAQAQTKRRKRAVG